MTLAIGVIGAGPAGATVARILAGQGAQVTLLESRRLPRPKLCGGGLTPKAQRSVPAAALETVERRIHRVRIEGGRAPSVELDAPAAEVAMVDRSRFDLALTEAAARAGAEVRDGDRVTGLTEGQTGVTVETRSGRMRFDLVVGADGYPSAIARFVGLDSPADRCSLALAVDVPLAPRSSVDMAVISFTVPGGYAWYLPKGDHASVGVGAAVAPGLAKAMVAALRPALETFAHGLELRVDEGRVGGHWVPQGLRRGRLATRRVIIVGDAAGTVEPLMGEGIAYAIASSVVACRTIADLDAGLIADARAYDGRLRRLLHPPLRRLALANAVAQRSATLGLLALRTSPWVRRYAVDVISGEQWPFAYPSVIR